MALLKGGEKAGRIRRISRTIRSRDNWEGRELHIGRQSRSKLVGGDSIRLLAPPWFNPAGPSVTNRSNQFDQVAIPRRGQIRWLTQHGHGVGDSHTETDR